MYISPFFEGARFFAKSRFDRWYILSAKYGLLHPGQSIDPYEKTLKRMPMKDRMRWAKSVLTALMARTKARDVLGFVAGNAYRQFLLPALAERGFRVGVPLEGLPIGMQLSWFNKLQSEQTRLGHLDKFYSLLAELEQGVGGKRTLRDCSGHMHWPEKGVYFFFEEGEMRTSCLDMSRVVRVGTHTVSKGSKTTLWHRLRTHRGSTDLTGNHRGSIFRLHVGAAMLAQSNTQTAGATWGTGQNASQKIRKLERDLEQEVSKYIGTMSLLWLAVGDAPGATSDRSYIERNVIALLSGPTGPFDLPGPRWLGRHSSREAIRRSGLWNVNYVDDAYDPQFLEVFKEYVTVTLGRRPPPDGPIAPRDWYLLASRKTDPKQMPLFDGRL